MISRKKAIFSREWIVVAIAFLVMLGFRGTTGSFGVFLKPIMAALHTTRGSTSGAMSIFMVLNGLVGVFAGWLTDRYGVRRVITGGALLAFLGYTLAYQINALWELYLYFGIIVGTSMGACFVPVNATVSKWFTEKRVLAVGITNSGVAIGQMTIPLLAAYFINGLGWRPAFVLMGSIILIASFPAMIWLRSNPPGGENGSSDNEAATELVQKRWATGKALRTVQFWMFIIIGFVTATGFYFLLVHVVPYATDMGETATSAALILTVMNVGTITAQILIWFLARKIGSRYTIVLMLGLQAIAMFLLIKVSSFPLLIIMVIVFGFGFGGSNTIRISMIPEIFGTRSGGEILGVISMAWAVGGLTGPLLAGYVFDLSQSYSTAFLTAGLLLVMGAASGMFLRAKEK